MHFGIYDSQIFFQQDSSGWLGKVARVGKYTGARMAGIRIRRCRDAQLQSTAVISNGRQAKYDISCGQQWNNSEKHYGAVTGDY